MKRFLVHVALFIPFALLFYIPALFIWGNFTPSVVKSNLNYKIGSIGHMFSRLQEVQSVHDINLLFLGSSHSYRGFDPRIFAKAGYTTFNLGSSAQTPIQTTVLVNRYLASINPELIVYEVYPETFMFDGVESSLDLIANDRNDLFSLNMALELNHLKTYNVLIYGALRDYFNLNESFKEPIKKRNDLYISGGYVESKDRHFSSQVFEKKKIEMRQYQLQSFSDLIKNIKSQNRDVILVYAPISPSMYSSYTNNSYFDSLMTNYSEYYNFNELITLNDSLHFSDAHHLNQSGVDIFDQKLIETLKLR